MSETLDRAAEIAKLARLLDTEAAEFAYLDTVPAAAIRRFRELATDRLFDGDGDRLRRVAAVSQVVPIPVIAQLVQRTVGAVGAAALAGLVEPDRAVKIAERLPLEFLAEVAVHLDPRRATAVIARMPAATVADVAVRLIARGDHVTVGRFVPYLPSGSLEASVDAVGDADLLRTAFVLEDKSRLPELAGLARERMADVVDAAHRQDLWAEALDLLAHLDDSWKRDLGDLVAARGPDVLDSLVRGAYWAGAFDTVLPVTRVMSPQSLRAFAATPAAHEPEVLRAIVEAAARHGLWDDLVPLTDVLPVTSRAQLSTFLGDLSADQLLAAVRSATRSGNVAALAEVWLGQPEDVQRRVFARLGEPRYATGFAATLSAETPEIIWAALAQTRDEMPPTLRARLAARAADCGHDELAAD